LVLFGAFQPVFGYNGKIKEIYLAPSAYEAMFASLAHSQADIKKTFEAAQNAFRKIKNEK